MSRVVNFEDMLAEERLDAAFLDRVRGSGIRDDDPVDDILLERLQVLAESVSRDLGGPAVLVQRDPREHDTALVLWLWGEPLPATSLH